MSLHCGPEHSLYLLYVTPPLPHSVFLNGLTFLSVVQISKLTTSLENYNMPLRDHILAV